jgi:ATP-dependent DNA helicase MPH1
MVISDIESDGEESDCTPSRRQEVRKRGVSISGDESEGAGDDLFKSEDPSEDSDASLGSLRDFLVEDRDRLSSSIKSQCLARSSTTSPAPAPAPDPALKRFKKPFILSPMQETSENDDDLSDLPDFIGAAKLRTQLASDELEEVVRPVSRHRENRRRVVNESDSDE